MPAGESSSFYNTRERSTRRLTVFGKGGTNFGGLFFPSACGMIENETSF